MADRQDVEQHEPQTAKPAWNTPQCRPLSASESQLTFANSGTDNVFYS
jgi:hypothetical protein